MKLLDRGRIVGLMSFVSLLSALSAAQSDRSWFAQKARELATSSRVLMISYAPLQEDPSSAILLYQSRGALLHMAYVTNGEGTAVNPHIWYPNQIAAKLREGAAHAAEDIDAGHTFLNMPHVDAVADSAAAWTLWQLDSLRSRLTRLFQEVRPDLVLVAGFDLQDTPQLMEPIFHSVFLRVLADLKASSHVVPNVVAFARSIAQAPSGRKPTASKKRLDRPAVNVETYWSKYEFRSRTSIEDQRLYSTLPGFPRKGLKLVSDVRSLLQPRRSVAIAQLDSIIVSLAKQAGRWTTPKGRSAQNARIQTLVDALGSIDRWTDKQVSADPVDRRVALDWRLTLEALRLRTMNIEAITRVSDSILTPRQLTYLTIDTISGLDPNGRTEVFFPKAKEGWILNERPGDRAALVLGKPYRLVSPLNYPADLPRDLDGLDRPQFRTPWYYFVVHWASKPERSFSLKLDAGLLGAPRFTAEIKNPVIMAAENEPLIIQLTNHSRDGFRDTLSVRTEHVWSEAVSFRLHAKGISVVDTLTLSFDPSWSDGSYLLPIKIGRDPVARFLVRKFSFRADSASEFLVVAHDAGDATSQAVRRLGVRMRSITPEALTMADLSSYRAVVLSEQVAVDLTETAWARLRSAINNGLHLVALWQPAESVALLPGGDRLTAKVVADLDTSVVIRTSVDDKLWTDPNDLRNELWTGWLYRRSETSVTVAPSVTVVASYAGHGGAAVVRWGMGKGTVHYVNMNLSHQFLNVLPSTYQLLANLLAY